MVISSVVLSTIPKLLFWIYLETLATKQVLPIDARRHLSNQLKELLDQYPIFGNFQCIKGKTNNHNLRNKAS